MCDDADDLDPFWLGCADAYQDAFADRQFVRERLRRQHLIHDHQISSGIAIGLGEGPAGQQARAQRVEIPRSNNLPVDRLSLELSASASSMPQRMALNPPASGKGNDAVTRSTPRNRAQPLLDHPDQPARHAAPAALGGRPEAGTSAGRADRIGSMRCSSRKVRNISPDQ